MTLLQETIESMKIETPEEQTPQPPKSNLKRNIILGTAAAIGALLLFSRKGKAKTQYELEVDMNLTKNIKLQEYLVSSSIPELKKYKLSLGEYNNVIKNATYLQILRDKFATPIFISSGGRPSTLKRESGKYKGLTFVQILAEKGYKPSLFSQHQDFSAADFTVENKKLLPLIFKYAIELKQKFPGEITQVILYIENGMPDFIHLGTKSEITDFAKVIEEPLLLGIVSTTIDQATKKRSTRFIPYTPENLQKSLYAISPNT